MDRPRRDRGPPAAPGDLVLDEPADPAILGRWRLLLTGWLAETLPDPGLDAAPDLVEDIVLAADEAVSNAVVHAYRDHRPGRVTLCAHAGPGAATVTVQVGDRGRWRPAPADPAHLGHGLPMIVALAGHVELVRTPVGTTVTMTWTTR